MKKIALLIAVQLAAIFAFGEGLKNERQVVIDTIFSECLQENRLISVYLPPDYNKSKTYPVIFATDGQLLDDEYKKSLDSLIKNGKLPGLIMIGAFSNEEKIEGTGLVYRNYEYIKDLSEDSVLKKRFENHMCFFTQEMIKYVEQAYPISKERKDRYFYGFSNGAGFGVTMSVQHPDLMGYYICISMAGGRYDDLKKGVNNYPYIDLLYGNKEPFPLTMKIAEFDKYLTKKRYNHNLTVYEGGHERKIWRRLFLERLVKIMND